MLASCRGGGLQFGRNLLDAHLLAVGPVEIVGLHRDQIDDAVEIVFLADGPLHEQGVAAHLLAHLPDDFFGIGADAVHLVDEGQARHVVALHLAVDGERLRLHAPHAAQHQNRAVQHAQAALHLDREIDVAGRVDQVDRVSLPGDGRGGAGDRDAPLAFEIHVVHGGAVAAAFDFIDPMDAAGIEEDPLAQGRFARVDMGRNADVS